MLIEILQKKTLTVSWLLNLEIKQKNDAREHNFNVKSNSIRAIFLRPKV